MEDQLDDFFKEKDTTLIFDMSNIAHNCLHAVIYTAPTDNGKFDLWKYAFVNSIFSHIQNFKPQRVVMACDGYESSWRYDFFKEYKWKRKLDREKTKDKINYDKFYEVFDALIEDLKTTFTNIKVLKEKRSEADDIIAVVTKEIKDDNIIIVSSDKDFNQLLIDRRIRQYKPIQKVFVECINPWKELQLKILTGDKSDSIPPIKPLVGPKTAGKIIEQGLEDFLNSTPVLRSNYERNKRLIDLSQIPEEFSNLIINNFTNYQISPLDAMKVFKFLNKHRLKKIADQWTIIGNTLKGLK